MSKTFAVTSIAITLVWMLLIGSGSALVSAATSTPTATLRPLLPSPTSAYLYLRPTPTPYTINVIPYSGSFLVDAGPIADTSINIWNFANRDHVLDFVVCGAIVIELVRLMIKLIGRYNKEAVNQG